MQRIAYHLDDIYEVDELTDADELTGDRLPGMPLLGFLTGSILSLALWGVVAVVALSM